MLSQPCYPQIPPACPADGFGSLLPRDSPASTECSRLARRIVPFFAIQRPHTSRTFSLARRRGNVRPCSSWKPNDPRTSPRIASSDRHSRAGDVYNDAGSRPGPHPAVPSGRKRRNFLTLRATMRAADYDGCTASNSSVCALDSPAKYLVSSCSKGDPAGVTCANNVVHDRSFKSSGYPMISDAVRFSMPSNVSTHANRSGAQHGMLAGMPPLPARLWMAYCRDVLLVPKPGELGENVPHPMRTFAAAPQLGKSLFVAGLAARPRTVPSYGDRVDCRAVIDGTSVNGLQYARPCGPNNLR